MTELRLLGLNACLRDCGAQRRGGVRRRADCSCGYYILRLYCTVAVSAAATPLGRREPVAVNKKAAEKSAFRRAGRRAAGKRRHCARLLPRAAGTRQPPVARPFTVCFFFLPATALLSYFRKADLRSTT